MNKLFFIIFLLISFTKSFAQDNRIQDPIKNFDKLWNEFNDRYSFFEIKNIDWKKSYKTYRPLINESTTNDSLFSVCEQMINELKDGHVTLVQYNKDKTILRENIPAYEDYLIKNFPISKEATPNIYQLLGLIDSTLTHYKFEEYKSTGNGVLQYRSSPNYGYIIISAMRGQPKKSFIKGIDQAVDAFMEKKGVIVDIRLNDGGEGDIALEIAGRFSDKKRVAHYVKERKKGTSNYTQLETTYSEPLGEVQFTKPIILLTSDYTASAAEEFVLAMKELPYVTIIGDNTDGMFSDRYNFKLPNKWRVSLSHQQYFDADMKNYEGVGVEPDIKLLNKSEDIRNEVAPLIVKAIEVLDRKSKR